MAEWKLVELLRSVSQGAWTERELVMMYVKKWKWDFGLYRLQSIHESCFLDIQEMEVLARFDLGLAETTHGAVAGEL